MTTKLFEIMKERRKRLDSSNYTCIVSICI